MKTVDLGLSAKKTLGSQEGPPKGSRLQASRSCILLQKVKSPLQKSLPSFGGYCQLGFRQPY